MQSAFVDIGLDRDAFLYVSDFFEDTEEYDKIVSTAEDQVAKLQQGIKEPIRSPQESLSPVPETGIPPNVVKYHVRSMTKASATDSRCQNAVLQDGSSHWPLKETAPILFLLILEVW